MAFERSNIAQMRGYTPGEQIREGSVIKLNTNENPYPASPAVAAALSAVSVDELRRYPSATADEFRHKAAELHEVRADDIIPTNGGDELLRLALTTFVGRNDTVLVTKPSYSLYPVLAEIQDCDFEEISLQDDWSMPDNFLDCLNISGAKMCILVNPHAPTGQLLPVEYLDEVASEFEGILLVDEAYVDFIDPELGYDSIPLIKKHDNILLLRSLSKGYSLAGLRFGYGIGPTSLIEPMMYKTRDSYNTDYVAQKLATAALESIDYARETWARVRKSRQILIDSLNELGLPTVPSQGNFVLSKVPDYVGAELLYNELKKRNILVRYFRDIRLRDKLRITVGSEDDNVALLISIGDVLESRAESRGAAAVT